MKTIEEIRAFDPVKTRQRHYSPMEYYGVQIEPWNHPRDIAQYILNTIQHTHMFGCQFIAPMGYGKTTAASIVAHNIHTINPAFQVVWAESSDFRHLKRFLMGLEKQPSIIIFDDITSALKQMSDKDIEKNFEDLTKIRWIVDPASGSVPMIVFVNYHYSKNLEKEFRAVLGMTIFLSFGAEEYTNIDTILPKFTLGRPVLEHFSRISDKMFTRHEFQLLHSTGHVITYPTDKPARACCAVMGKEARIILLALQDQCEKCSKTNFRKFADSKQVYDDVVKIYGKFGKMAWKLACMKRGFYSFDSRINTALNFIEGKIATQFSIRWEEVQEIIKKDNRHKTDREYHKRKAEDEALELLEKTAEKVEIIPELPTDENLSNSTSTIN